MTKKITLSPKKVSLVAPLCTTFSMLEELRLVLLGNSLANHTTKVTKTLNLRI